MLNNLDFGFRLNRIHHRIQVDIQIDNAEQRGRISGWINTYNEENDNALIHVSYYRPVQQPFHTSPSIKKMDIFLSQCPIIYGRQITFYVAADVGVSYIPVDFPRKFLPMLRNHMSEHDYTLTQCGPVVDESEIRYDDDYNDNYNDDG